MDLDGGERKKRRTQDHVDEGQHHHHQEAEEDASEEEKMKAEEDASEEEKMKAFFDLILATRGARERLFGRKQAEEEEKGRQPARPRVWNPAFQPDDFIDDRGGNVAKVSEVKCCPSHSETNSDKGGQKNEDDGRMKREGEVNLDLSL